MRNYPLFVEWDLEPHSENIEVTPSLLSQSMFFYVQAVGHFYARSRYFTEREHYNSFLLLWTKSGNGTLTYRDKTYNLEPNSMILIDCKERHFYQTGRASKWEMVWVHFNGGSSQSYFELIMKNTNSPVHHVSESSSISKLAVILDAHRQRTLHTDILNSQRIVEILTELLLQSIHPQATQHADAAQFPSHILDIMNMMEKNCSTKITLDDLAAQHNFSKYHLAREFKRYTGYSLIEYLTHLRISLAKDMLKYSALSIQQIAERVGFNQTSYFIKTFKVREGLTPLEFRKKWR